MGENGNPGSAGSLAKDKYHHGDLREALIDASFTLISRDGAENFLLADACRLAGVSTAAPYKHFRDRDEVLEIVVERGFDVMSERLMSAVAQAGEGTREGIMAMGQAYIAFALEEQPLFRLMFGQHPVIKQAESVVDTGRQCFGNVIEQVNLFFSENNLEGDATEVAVRLWTFVHGAASLLIDEEYEKVVPDLDIEKLVQGSAPLLLGHADVQ